MIVIVTVLTIVIVILITILIVIAIVIIPITQLRPISLLTTWISDGLTQA